MLGLVVVGRDRQAITILSFTILMSCNDGRQRYVDVLCGTILPNVEVTRTA